MLWHRQWSILYQKRSHIGELSCSGISIWWESFSNSWKAVDKSMFRPQGDFAVSDMLWQGQPDLLIWTVVDRSRAVPQPLSRTFGQFAGEASLATLFSCLWGSLAIYLWTFITAPRTMWSKVVAPETQVLGRWWFAFFICNQVVFKHWNKAQIFLSLLLADIIYKILVFNWKRQLWDLILHGCLVSASTFQ